MLACKRRRISGCHFDFRLNHAKWHPGIASYALTCWTWINMLKGDTNNVLEISSDVSRSQEISDVLTGHGYKMFPIPILEIFSIPSGDQIPVPETISHFTHSEPSSGVSGVRVGIRFIFWAQKVFGIHSCLTLCWQFKFDVVLRCNKLEILNHVLAVTFAVAVRVSTARKPSCGKWFTAEFCTRNSLRTPVLSHGSCSYICSLALGAISRLKLSFGTI